MKDFHSNFLESLSLVGLDQTEYSLVGSGGYVQILLRLLKERNAKLPKCILSTNHSSGLLSGIDVIPLEQASTDDVTERVVLGSDTFQIELMARVSELVPSCLFIDVADEVQASLLHVEPLAKPKVNKGKPYAVFIAVAHSGPRQLWLRNYIQWLETRGISLYVKHPLSQIDDDLLNKAVFVLLWNGTMRHFDKVHQQLEHLNLKPSYAECGYFPQSQHFYFDRDGVNARSQLMKDSLGWLNADDFARVDEYRQKMFGSMGYDTDEGFIFVPLQVESDSNVQFHSRFRQGMQQYIDYLVAEYPEKKLVFKPHPKDAQGKIYNPHHGIISHENTLSLIARSSLVRGINSSVLFEAALIGKPVICDGESLLKHSCGDHEKVLAAMIARQYHVEETDFGLSKLKRFSRMGDFFG